MEEFIDACRTCLRHDEKLLPITSIVETNCQIVDYFKKYLQLNISLDEVFPNNICVKCLKKLLEVRKFYLQCQDSENYLKLKFQSLYKISNSKLVIEQNNKVDEDSQPADSNSESELNIIAENDENVFKKECEEEYMELDELIDEDSQTTSNIGESEEVRSNIGENEEGEESNELEILEEYDTTVDITQENSKEQQNYVCKLCNESFSLKANYNIHMKRHANKKWTKNESSICPVCGKTFENKTKLQKHIYNHNKLNRVSCQICNKPFRAKYDLNLHMNIHTGAKPFKCNVCNKSFAAPSSLRTHKTLHDGKKFDCPMCDTKLAHKAQLKRHMRMHTNERPYACSLCPNRYKQLCALKVHLAIHAGVKSEKCDECSACFVSKLHLYSHKFKVHRPKRFHCNKCIKQFATPFQMKSHLLSVHKICVKDLSSYDSKVKNLQS